MSLSIAGKTAIVTGAANGIGLQVARHFLDKGANVMFADIDEARLEEEVGKACKAEGGVRMFAGDLRQKLSVANLLSATYDAFDRVDILVNASRRMVTSDPLGVEDDAVEELWQQNVMTALRVSQMTARRMCAAADKAGADGPVGSIVNLSSIAATRTQGPLLAYSMAAAAIDQMTRSMAVALAPRRIRVNAVAFGSVMSASLQAALKENPNWRSAVLQGTPMGRIAGPQELAETVQYLASDAASFVTGQVLTVDGGRTLVDAVDAPAH
jgi:7-alpha-hydroxysteroid dehydrogenase